MMFAFRKLLRTLENRRRIQTKMSLLQQIQNNKRTKTDHLQRTAGNTREEVISQATIIGMRHESTTVKSLLLKVHNESFSFKAGQWVDMFIPKVDKVGGFSMCSSPKELDMDGTIKLAIKKSEYPPAKWVHTQCQIGSTVSIRSGGDIYYDPKPTSSPGHLLLIAGGIGINPLLSIAKHAADVQQCKGDYSEENTGKTLLLYSAKSKDELIFKDEICRMSSANFKAKFFVTADKSSEENLYGGRICADDISSVWQELNPNKTLCYLCGPPPMISCMEKLLINSGLKSQCILVEKWW